MTLRCLEALLAVDWPAERLESSMVDNASIDGIVAGVARASMPDVRVIEHTPNAGFAGGCNLGMQRPRRRRLRGAAQQRCDRRAELAAAAGARAEADPELGAACSKIVFAARVRDAASSTTPTFRPSGRRPRARRAGHRLAVDGGGSGTNAASPTGCHAAQTGGPGTSTCAGPTGRAEIRVPVEPGAPSPSAIAGRAVGRAPEGRPSRRRRRGRSTSTVDGATRVARRSPVAGPSRST